MQDKSGRLRRPDLGEYSHQDDFWCSRLVCRKREFGFREKKLLRVCARQLILVVNLLLSVAKNSSLALLRGLPGVEFW